MQGLSRLPMASSTQWRLLQKSQKSLPLRADIWGDNRGKVVLGLMGLLHRLRRRWIRLGRPSLPAPARRGVLSGPLPLPSPLTLRSPALLIFALVLGAGIFWLAVAGPVQAVPPATTATTASTTTTEFTLQGGVKVQVDNLTAQANAVQAQIDALTDELEQKSEQYNKCLDDLDSANQRMSELRRMVTDAQAEKAQRQALLDERLKSVYMSGGRDQLLQMLLLADGMKDLYNRVRLVATLADQDKRLVTDLKESSNRLDLLLTAVEEQKSQELALRDELSTRAAEIQVTLAEREKTLSGLDTRVAAVIEQERQRQKAEQERLQRELEARLAAAALAAQAAQAAAQAHVLNGGQIYHGTLPQTDNEILNQVVETAASYLGIPYVWGGSRPSTGMDCSGFVRYVFRQHGVNLPHYSGYQAQLGIPVDLADIQPGDLVAFGFPVHHVGIYIGDGLFIHTPGDYVKIQKLSSRKNLAAIRRFPLKLRTGPALFQ
jgi:cell wall-associated NlpC family hydrolase